jgi:hypothetical protein
MEFTMNGRATAMTRDKLPNTKYNMYNKVEFLAAWKQVVEFYGCQDNFKTAEMPEGYDLEAWRRGHSSRCYFTSIGNLTLAITVECYSR